MRPVSTIALENFLERVRGLQRSRSKQFVLSAEEANDLAVVIAMLLLEKTDHLKQIVELQNASEIVEVKLSGGSFGSETK